MLAALNDADNIKGAELAGAPVTACRYRDVSTRTCDLIRGSVNPAVAQARFPVGVNIVQGEIKSVLVGEW